jgi:hypothetical protein
MDLLKRLPDKCIDLSLVDPQAQGQFDFNTENKTENMTMEELGL